MTPEESLDYLANFVNQAVIKGGFNLNDSANASVALQVLKKRLDADKNPQPVKKDK